MAKIREHMDNTFLDPFIEGATMNKYNGKYYLQYGAPGTEFSGYADGVVVGETPLGPFTPQSDPMSFKPGGFSAVPVMDLRFRIRTTTGGTSFYQHCLCEKYF